MVFKAKKWLLPASLLAFSCIHWENHAGGAGAGNPEKTKITISLTLESSTESGFSKVGIHSADSLKEVSLTDEGGLRFIVTEASANITEVTFEKYWDADEPEGPDFPDSEEPEEDEVKVAGPFVMDLLSGKSQSSALSFKVPEGLYEAIEISLKNNNSEGNPMLEGDPLYGNAMALRGRYESGDTLRGGFSLHLPFEIELEIRNDSNSASFKGDSAYIVQAALQIGKWFKDINIKACIESGDISVESDNSLKLLPQNPSGLCSNMEDKLKANISSFVSSSIEIEVDDEDVKEDESR